MLDVLMAGLAAGVIIELAKLAFKRAVRRAPKQ
jgi:hypothetical protein